MKNYSCTSVWLFIITLTLFVLLPITAVNGNFLEWFWGEDIQPSEKLVTSSSQHMHMANGVPLVKVPFEAKTDDEKFLVEAQKFTEIRLSALDTCQHKVIMKIRTSCTAMTEEELAKLSVNLLNCQSAIEGRQLFPCTESMSLRECTGDMDSDTWNSYHLMNNRARAVCYAARQQQFRAMTEMTVNKLVNTAVDQLDAMKVLQDGQEKLETMTSGTLDKVSEGHKDLMLQQERLRTTQQNIQQFVAFNLKELTREKSLIAAGHRELAEMTSKIKEKLDLANVQLTDQSTERQKDHKRVLDDLESIQNQAVDIWNRIDKSTQQILAQHAAAATQYQETLENLARINSTVHFLLNLLDETRKELDHRLGWIANLMGGTGDQIGHLYSCVLHVCYLLVGMVATAFLQAPMLTRVILMLIVPLNMSLLYNQGHEIALNFPTMTVVIVACTVANWIICALHGILMQKTSPLYLRGSTVPQYHANGYRNCSRTQETGAGEDGPQISSKESLQSRVSSPVKIFCNAAVEQLKNIGTAMSPTKWFQTSTPLKAIDTNSRSSNGNIRRPNGVPSNLSNYSMQERDDESSDSDVSIAEPAADFKQATQVIDHARQDLLRNLDPDNIARQRFPSRNLSSSFSNLLGNHTPTSSRSGSPLRSGTPRFQCQAVCKNGQSCRNSSLVGRDVCYRHSLDTSLKS